MLLPPVPFLLLTLVGARMIAWRRIWAWLLVLTASAGIWLSACVGVGALLTRALVQPPPALTPAQIAQRAVEFQSFKIE